jgi:hypothetical protein
MKQQSDQSWGRVFCWRYALTPLVINWVQYRKEAFLAEVSTTWRELYVFGVRLARWRGDAP